MSLEYKNPISPVTVSGPVSVPINSNVGTNFGILSIGGYQEVEDLSDLIFTIPSGITGDILYSGNTIPVQLSISPVVGFPDTLVLNSDGVSSGRRRLGMMVSVVSENKNFIFQISGYTELFNNALISGSIVETDFGYEVNNSTPEGQLLIDAWTGSTIEGVSGYTNENANWKIFSSSSWQITGGTYFSGTTTLELYDNTGGTISVTGFTSESGVSGLIGQSGISGVSGVSGVSGLVGQNGIAGVDGESGISGFSGESGISGEFGISGTSGLLGNSGISGLSGLSGLSGDSGLSGVSGLVGQNGIAGVDGESGISGLSGESGLSGIYSEITGGTYFSGSSTLELYDNNGNTVSVSGFSSNVQVSGNTGLGTINNVLFTTYNTLLDSSLSMAGTVGGLTAGTTVSQLSGKTFVSLFDDLLFPTQNPTYTIPTITISGVANSTVEVGSTLSLSLSSIGIKNDAGNFTQIRLFRNGSAISTYTGLTPSSQTNVANQFGYTNPNSPNSGFTISPTPYAESYVIPAPAGVSQTTSTTYNADGNYSAGLPKNNNKGVLDVRTPQVRSTNAPQAASTSFQTSTFTYTGIYPYYYGLSSTEPTLQTVKDAISGGTATKVLASASGNLSITYNANTQFLWFAHFGNYTLKSQWFVAADNKGLMSTTSLFDPGTLTQVSSATGLWNNVNFYVYLGNYATTLTSITVGNGLF